MRYHGSFDIKSAAWLALYAPYAYKGTDTHSGQSMMQIHLFFSFVSYLSGLGVYAIASVSTEINVLV
jgi:hypothetical protein